jgi:hypothetical protein
MILGDLFPYLGRRRRRRRAIRRLRPVKVGDRVYLVRPARRRRKR